MRHIIKKIVFSLSSPPASCFLPGTPSEASVAFGGFSYVGPPLFVCLTTGSFLFYFFVGEADFKFENSLFYLFTSLQYFPFCFFVSQAYNLHLVIFPNV